MVIKCGNAPGQWEAKVENKTEWRHTIRQTCNRMKKKRLNERQANLFLLLIKPLHNLLLIKARKKVLHGHQTRSNAGEIDAKDCIYQTLFILDFII